MEILEIGREEGAEEEGSVHPRAHLLSLTQNCSLQPVGSYGLRSTLFVANLYKICLTRRIYLPHLKGGMQPSSLFLN